MNADTSGRTENDEALNVDVDDDDDDDDQRRKPEFLFSVEYILNKAGEKKTESDAEKNVNKHYDWLYCTRFKPPKLDRIKKKDGENRQKRTPGRNPRIPFTTQQIAVLEREYRRSAYLGGINDVILLSERLQLSQSRIKIWFQNRRARDRRDNNNPSGSFCCTSSSVQQRQLPVSSTSAFKPLQSTYSYTQNNLRQ